jgi:hypothetical protein
MEKVTRIPTPIEIRAMYDEYGVPMSIRRHIERVRDVGVAIAQRMKTAGTPVNVGLVEAGCLIHDAFKTATVSELKANPEFEQLEPTEKEITAWKKLREEYGGKMHETLVAAEKVREKYPEFAKFVANIGSTGNPTYLNPPSHALELQILHYADWRVQFVNVIPFAERLEYLRKTYLPRHPDRGQEWWNEMLTHEFEIEKRLFEKLDVTPEQLKDIVPTREYHERPRNA